MVNTSNRKLIEASKANPCPHCGKPDWCYSLDELTVCKRESEPATGWHKTTKQDADGNYYYAPVSEKKPVRPKGITYWEYPSRDGKKLVRVKRIDDGQGKKEFKQQRWDGKKWVDGLRGFVNREDIPIYNYKAVREAINTGQIIFVCEGETCADALIALGLIATTNIGGSKGWNESDAKDLEGASLCLVPDRDKPGMKLMENISQHFPDAKWLYPYPTSFMWQRLPESNGVDLADWISDFKLGADDILNAVTEKKQTVTSDSDKNGDTSKPDTVSFADTVTTVTAILREGYSDWVEQQKLDELEAKTEMSKKAFWQLVASVRCNLEEVQPEDSKLFEQLINWHDTKLDVEAVLPHLGADILHDARVLNIDPVAILHPLLPAVLSLLSNKVCLDVESHQEPPLLYSCLVGESGTGKTRGQKLIFTPLEKLQATEKKRFDSEMADYKRAIEAGEQTDKPHPQRKYLFKVSTIQAVIKRLADQSHGSIWSRDEIAGLFKSLDQFSNGTGEALEMLLELWNSGLVQVDRVSEDDSFLAKDTCLSIYGGIQPGKFSEIFKDPNDANGLQARFLFAVINVQPAKRVKGYCRLSEKLPDLYEWVNKWVMPGVRFNLKLSEAADKRYTKVYEQIGEQAEKSSLPAIRGWMRKLPAQILRIAIALHAIDCYFEQGRPRGEIQLDTLNRAIDLCRYYRNSFALVQEKASDSDNPASILWKIWDEAVKRPSGLLCRDAYRIVKAIQRRAREVGRAVGAYTLDLFKQLENQGWGSIERGENKRAVRFVAIAKPNDPPTEPPPPPTEPPPPPTEPPSPPPTEPPSPPPTEPPSPPPTEPEPNPDNYSIEDGDKYLEDWHKWNKSNSTLPPSEPPRDDLSFCVELVRTAIAATDPQTAEDVQGVLRQTCEAQPELRSQIWKALNPEEREAFKRLCQPTDEQMDLVALTAKYKVGDKVITPSGLNAEITAYAGFGEWGNKGTCHRYDITIENEIKARQCEQNLRLPSVDGQEKASEQPLDIVAEEKPKPRGILPGDIVRPRKGKGFAAEVVKTGVPLEIRYLHDEDNRICTVGNTDVVPLSKFAEQLKKGIFKVQLKALRHPSHDFYKKPTRNQGTLEAIMEKDGKFWARVACKSGLELFNLEAVEVLLDGQSNSLQIMQSAD